MTQTKPPAANRLALESVSWQPAVDLLTDAELLRRFIAHREEEAFAQMVRRHGPMVQRACQRIVGSAHDADDAFQATFMVLVRRAGCIQPPGMLGAWLHGVACRCSLAQRQKRLKQHLREQALPEGVDVETPPVEARDWLPYLDEEIERLPEIYRRPVVLCELLGRGRQEAATILGLAAGTLSSRLAKARKRLAQRLAHRGLVSVAALGSWLAMNTSSSAEMPESLVQSTTQLGMKLATHPATAALSPSVAFLTQGAIQSMFISKCKMFALVALGVGSLSFGCWFVGSAGATEPVPTATHSSSPVASEPVDDQDRPGKKRNNSEKQETIVGSGNITTTTRQLSGFNSIQLLNAGKLTIKQTGKEKLTLRTDDNLAPLLQTEVVDSMLVLKNATQANLKPSKDNEYTIEVKSLGKVDIKGAGTITIEGLNGKAFEVDVQGAGTVTLEGQTGTLVIKLLGAGTVNAEKLSSDHADVSIPGSGTIKVNAKDDLKATIFGAGSIQYAGSPKVTKAIRGAGSISKLPEAK